MSVGILYIVATPIGNLEDISLRALRILKEVDLILCEDTRRSKKLLARYEITTPTLSYHQHSKFQKINYILELLGQGKNLALVSDAGTPGISDPGNKLVNEVLRCLGNQVIQHPDAQVPIIPIPGPSALTAALSICGFPTDKFIFLGFPPHKKGRQKFFTEVTHAKYTNVFYESPHRILKALEELNKLAPDREIVVARELTKKFEFIYRGKISEVFARLKKEKIRGEFVVIIKNKGR